MKLFAGMVDIHWISSDRCHDGTPEYPKIARAFLATAPRPIVHELPDKDDPHDVFCGIMRRLRDELVAEHALAAGTP